MLKSLSFFSNFLNHHQLPFCESMVNKLGEGFKFIATMPIPPNHLKIGYEDINSKYSFVVRAYENEENYSHAMRLACDSDLVIMAGPEIFFKKRLVDNKISFRYSERIFKRGIWRVLDPRILKEMYLNHFRFRKNNLFILCASAYTAGDFALVKCYEKKMYKWGYFPEVYEYEIQSLLEKKRDNEKIKILWVGRMLKWKHPETAILVAEHLKREDIDFELQIIGGGDQEPYIRELILLKDLTDQVKIIGFMPHQMVRGYMEKANIFLFTSDFQEGWGTVLNEAMNSGCVVIASHAIGSVPYLIDNGKNGLIYKNNNLNNLFDNVKKAIDDEALRYKLGYNAYLTLSQTWNSKNAADNLLKLYSIINDGKKNPIIYGPCSTAKPIKQNQMYDYCLGKYGND